MYYRPAPTFNIPRRTGLPKSGPVGSQYRAAAPHGTRPWGRRHWYMALPWGISQTPSTFTSRMALRRSAQGSRWSWAANYPEVAKWEKIVNGMRVTEDRWSLVEEDGELHKINWELYSRRLDSEIIAAKEHMPQHAFLFQAAPISWKKLDLCCATIKGLSAREAVAQCKLSDRKGHHIILRAIENAQRGAEQKGLDREKLRIGHISCWKGPTDKQIDIRSRGYYAWKSKKSSHLLVILAEDPEMHLPDRTTVPFSTVVSLKRAGIYHEPTVIDVPAITAEGI